MLGHRELTMSEYAGILKRRFWLILISAILFLGVGIALSRFLPPQYVSQTLVIVQQQKVPEDYVKSVVTEDLNARLASMKEQILSRSRLEPIIGRFNLFAGNNTTMDDRVEMTRKGIVITPILSGASKIPGFYISFRAQSARTAQQVCGEITSLFVSESLNAREQSAEGTTAFLAQQLADAKRALDDQDARLATFQRKYIGKLPGQEQSNMNTLQALTTQLDAATQSLNRMHQDETFIETMISQQANEFQRAEPATAVSADLLHLELKRLVAQKNDLETLYTPDHPDVVALSRKIADLQSQIAATPNPQSAALSKVNAGRPEPPQLQQARAQLRSLQQSIVTQKEEQARIAQRIRTYESRIESSPMIEQEFKQITRDHETALQFYNTLLTKMNESSMATNLERRQQGEQFQVLDAANLAEQPTFPNPYIFAGGGFALGLLLGLLMAGLLEYRDTSLRSDKDVWAFTKLPTLATISYIDGLPKPVLERRSWKLFARTNKLAQGVKS